MKLSQVALQLYTLREFTQTEQDFAATMKRVREIGYQAIQVSAVGPIPARRLREIADGEGLAIVATHEPTAKLLDEPEAVIERLNDLGTKNTAFGSTGLADLANLDAVKNFICRAEASAEKFAAAGKVLGYHNHAIEFYHYEPRKTVYDLIFSSTKALVAELDTFWVHAGGANVEVELRKLAGRIPFIHIKDFGVTSVGERYFAEIGYGNLDFRSIIAAAEAGGCEWFIVEQDRCPGDPFVSIAKSFNYIKENLVTE